jgi:hypothetical protein
MPTLTCSLLRYHSTFFYLVYMFISPTVQIRVGAGDKRVCVANGRGETRERDRVRMKQTAF